MSEDFLFRFGYHDVAILKKVVKCIFTRLEYHEYAGCRVLNIQQVENPKVIITGKNNKMYHTRLEYAR